MKLNDFVPFFDLKLNELLSKLQIYEPFREVVSYTPLVGGKRLRAYLIWELATGTAFGKKNALKTGFAVELFHSGSLVHDDLPAIDNDSLRRGKPANHIKFGEAGAILAGDYLMLYPLKILSSLNLGCVFRQKILDLWSEVTLRVVEGEYADVSPLDKSENLLEFIYENKTAALFGFSFAAPFVENPEKFDSMYRLGLQFGKLFQMMDDIKDASSSIEELGKTPGKDAVQNKLTLLSFHEVSQAKKIVREGFKTFIGDLGEHQTLSKELENIYEYILKS